MRVFVFIWLSMPCVSCRIFRCGMWNLVPWPGIEAGPPELGAWSLSHWTTRAICVSDNAANKGLSCQSYGFSSGHVWMWELDCKESWAPKNWCFWILVLEKILESPLDCKEMKPINPKGNQSWIFIWRSDAEAETPILWPPDLKKWFIGKDPDAGKDWRQEEKGMTEDEMVWWYHWLDGREFEQALGVGDGQGSLECCSAWDHKESDMTKQLNSNNHM